MIYLILFIIIFFYFFIRHIISINKKFNSKLSEIELKLNKIDDYYDVGQVWSLVIELDRYSRTKYQKNIVSNLIKKIDELSNFFYKSKNSDWV